MVYLNAIHGAGGLFKRRLEFAELLESELCCVSRAAAIVLHHIEPNGDERVKQTFANIRSERDTDFPLKVAQFAGLLMFLRK